MFMHFQSSRPTRYSTQSLTRDTNGRIDRLLLGLEHKLANRRFEAERRVPLQPLQAAFPGIESQRVIVQYAVQGPNALANADPQELIILSSLCARLTPRLVMEFGTFDGLTALHLAINGGPDSQIVTIDLPPDAPVRQETNDDTFYSKGVQVGERFHHAPERTRIEQVLCDTTRFDESPYLGRVGLGFIDAGHQYDLVRSDSLKMLKMVAPGGIILWHDYHYAHEGVYRWLNELAIDIPLFQISGTKFVCHIDPRPAANAANPSA